MRLSIKNTWCMLLSLILFATFEQIHADTMTTKNVSNIIQVMSISELFNSNLLSGVINNTQPTAGQFTMSGASSVSGYNSIRFLRLAFYNGTYAVSGCGGELIGVLSVLDNTYGMPFINGQVVSLNAYSIYNLLMNSLLSSSIASIQCMQVYMDGSNNYAHGVISTAFQETCTGGGSSNCATTTAPQAGAWVINPIQGYNKFLYAPSIPATGQDVVFGCIMSPTDGSLSDCFNMSDGISLPNAPLALAFNNQFVYLASMGLNQILYCQVHTITGAFNSCNKTLPIMGGNPYGIAISAGYIYFSEPTVPAVNVCQLIYSNTATNGSIDQTTCQTYGTGLGITAPYGLSVYNGNLYIATTETPGVLFCPILSNGTLGACTSAIGAAAGGPHFNVYGVTFYNGYMYFASSPLNGVNGAVYACSIDGSGKAASCISTAIPNVQSVVFNNGTTNNFAYVSSQGFSVRICEVSVTNGSLGSCPASTVGTSTSAGAVY